MSEALLDLIVLVADKDAEITVQTLLDERTKALGIRPLSYEIFNEPGHDPAVFQRAETVLRFYLGQASHALVMLDYDGCGQEAKLSAQEVEADIVTRLTQNGWSPENICVIVLEPELEIWVWSPSKHVAEILGLRQAEREEVLAAFTILPNNKPERPKEAMEAALKYSKRPRSARIFGELAERVSLRVNEPAFDKFRDTLQKWFPTG